VDDGVGAGDRRPDGRAVAHVTRAVLRATGGVRRGGGVEHDDVVPRGHEVGRDDGADETPTAGHEDAHVRQRRSYGWPVDTLPQVDVGIIGGSGFYEFLDEPRFVDVDTPWGPPSAPVAVGSVGGRGVAFLPRHGRDHRFPPHRIPYRANLWALRRLGVAQVLTPCAVGSLQRTLEPGDLVVPDQLVDRTSGRGHTYYDDEGGVEHLSFADPYSATGRDLAVTTARAQGATVHDGGTLVVIQGPRFSTRAESRWYSAQGWSVVGMTGAPEAALAAELGLECTCVAMVTDYDAGLQVGEGVTQEEVFAVMSANLQRLRDLLGALVPALPRTDPPALPTRLAGR